MRASSLIKLTRVVGVVSVLVGCTSLFSPNRHVTPPPLKADSAAEALQPLADSQLQAVRADKDDEPEDDAEPQIQAMACGQASGEAIPEGATMQPQLYDPGEGATDTIGSYDEGRDPQMCVSQWGYDYRKIPPVAQVTPTSVSFGTPMVGNYIERAFVVWNYGGRRLQGTVTVNAPFGVAAGGSFDLGPGEPQIIRAQVFHEGKSMVS